MKRIQRQGRVRQDAYEAFVSAIQAGDIDACRQMIDRREVLLDTMEKHEDEQSALMIAARSAQQEIVKLLLELGADPRRFIEGENALHAALIGGDVATLETLLGWDPDLIVETATEQGPEWVAQLATTDRMAAWPEELRSKFAEAAHAVGTSRQQAPPPKEIEPAAPIERRLLKHIRTGRSLSKIEELVNLGARLDVDPVPLIAASGAGRLDVVRLLLGRGADPEYTGTSRWNPLTMAATEGRMDVVKFWIEEHGLPLSCSDPSQRTAADRVLDYSSGDLRAKKILLWLMARATEKAGGDAEQTRTLLGLSRPRMRKAMRIRSKAEKRQR